MKTPDGTPKFDRSFTERLLLKEMGAEAYVAWRYPPVLAGKGRIVRDPVQALQGASANDFISLYRFLSSKNPDLQVKMEDGSMPTERQLVEAMGEWQKVDFRDGYDERMKSLGATGKPCPAIRPGARRLELPGPSHLELVWQAMSDAGPPDLQARIDALEWALYEWLQNMENYPEYATLRLMLQELENQKAADAPVPTAEQSLYQVVHGTVLVGLDRAVPEIVDHLKNRPDLASRQHRIAVVRDVMNKGATE